MNCPTCKVELKMADRQGVEIDYSPQCRGVWLDRGELDKILERAATYQQPVMPQPPTDPRLRYDRDDDDDRRYPKRKKSMWHELFD